MVSFRDDDIAGRMTCERVLARENAKEMPRKTSRENRFTAFRIMF
jgi:hypothetical protein